MIVQGTTRHILPMLIALATALLCCGAGPEAAPWSEDDGRIMALTRNDGVLLSEDFIVFPRGERWFLPLGQFAYQLELALTVSPQKGVVSGFVYREQAKFSFDATAGTVARQGVETAVAADRYVVTRDDVYIDVELVHEWFPLETKLDLYASSLVVRPLEPLPSQQAKEREHDARMDAASQRQRHPDLPLRLVPRDYLDGLYADQTLALGRGYEPDTGAETHLDHHTVVAGELLGWEARAEWSGKDEDVQRSRYGLARFDADGGMLGVLGAREIRLLDFFYPSLPLVGSTGEGRGFYVSNAPLDLSSTFGSHTLTGYLAPGWDVDLYRNGVFIGRQTVGADGYYQFPDIPLAYGANQFRMNFYGPQGQRDERLEVVDIDRSMLAPGKMTYRLAVGEDKDHQRKLSAQYDLGLAPNLSVVSGWTRFSDKRIADDELTYGNVGLRGLLPSLVAFGDGSFMQSGGRALQVGVRAPFPNVAVGVKRIWLTDYRSALFSDDDADVIHRLESTLEGYAATTPSIAAALTHQRDALTADRSRSTLLATLGTSLRSVYVGNETRWRHDDQGRFWAAKATLNTFLDRHEDRVDVLYDGTGVTQSIIRHNIAWSPEWRSELSWDHDYVTAVDALSLVQSRRLQSCNIAYRGSWADTGAWTVAAEISYGFGVDPARRTTQVTAHPVADQGAVAVQVFLDRDMDGAFGDGDEPLAGVRVLLDGRRLEARTDATGWLWLTGLEAERKHGLEVDLESLEDPAYQPATKGFQFTPRRGKTFRTGLAVISTGEIEGVVWLEDAPAAAGAPAERRPRGGIKIQLLDANDRVVASTVNSSDGYYLLDKIPPGEFRLSLDPKQLDTLGLKTVLPARTIRAAGDGSIVSGQDFVLFPQ